MYCVTALYARVSSERRAREGTIASQLEALRSFVAQQGWSVDPDREFVDNGVSGTTLDRPVLDRLRDAIVAGQIQRVVTSALTVRASPQLGVRVLGTPAILGELC